MQVAIKFLLVFATASLCVSCGADRPSSVLPPKSITLDQPVYEIGINDELEHPASATRLPNGNVAVADVFAATIKFFDANGKLFRTVGRKGSGPGEYQAAGWIARCSSDSLYVFDGALFRMSVLDTAGKFVRQFVEMEPMSGGLACARDRDLHTYFISPGGANHLDQPGGPRQRKLGDLGLFNGEGEVKRRIEKLLLWEGMGRPFPRGGSVAIGGDFIWYGNADSAFVDKYSLRGKKLGSIPVGLERRPVSQSDLDTYIEAVVAVFQDQRTRDVNRQIIRRYPIPKWLPIYNGLRADPDGNVWVISSYVGETPTRLRCVSPTGVARLDVVIPHPFRVMEIGRDYILGSYEKDDQPRVAMYRY